MKTAILGWTAVTLATASGLGAQTALAEDWPVGVSCKIHNTESNTITDVSQVSSGPWVMVERTLSNQGNQYTLHVDASNQYSRVVIYLKNTGTNHYGLQYGQIATHQPFSLNFEGWQITCSQWPYIAG